MRLFVAIEPGPQACEILDTALTELRPSSPSSKWVPARNIHITVAFLGEVDDQKVDAITLALARAAQACAPATARIAGGGSFGPPRHPRILWAGVTGDPDALAAIQRAQESAQRELLPLGFTPEDRAWTPHLTLARARDPRGDAGLRACVEALAGRDFCELRVDALVLYRSDLSSTGPRYTAIARLPLGGAPPDIGAADSAIRTSDSSGG